MVTVASGKILDWEHHGWVTENNHIAISQISSRELPFYKGSGNEGWSTQKRGQR